MFFPSFLYFYSNVHSSIDLQGIVQPTFAVASGTKSVVLISATVIMLFVLILMRILQSWWMRISILS